MLTWELPWSGNCNYFQVGAGQAVTGVWHTVGGSSGFDMRCQLPRCCIPLPDPCAMRAPPACALPSCSPRLPRRWWPVSGPPSPPWTPCPALTSRPRTPTTPTATSCGEPCLALVPWLPCGEMQHARLACRIGSSRQACYSCRRFACTLPFGALASCCLLAGALSILARSSTAAALQGLLVPGARSAPAHQRGGDAPRLHRGHGLELRGPASRHGVSSPGVGSVGCQPGVGDCGGRACLQAAHFGLCRHTPCRASVHCCLFARPSASLRGALLLCVFLPYSKPVSYLVPSYHSFSIPPGFKYPQQPFCIINPEVCTTPLTVNSCQL